MLETIKNAFPLAFDLSLTHLEKIAPKYDFYLSEDEIGYIALHLAGAIERNGKETIRKQKVAIVCGSGKTMSKLIEMKITRKFADSVEIIGKYSYAEIQSCTLTAIDIIVTTIPFNRAGSKVIFIDVINLDRDLDQLQAAISHSKNSSRSETIQLFDKNHFYFLEHPPTKAELLNSMVGKGRTWPNQSQQYSGHSASNVIDSVQVGCPCSYDPERHRLGRRSPCEIRLPILDN